MKILLPCLLFTLTVARCTPGSSEHSSVNLQDSVLVQHPDWTVYYCDTIRRIDSIPCVEELEIKSERKSNYYVISEYTVGDSTAATRDTFFITKNRTWYQLHNNSWHVFFSRDTFRLKQKTTILRNNFGSSNVEEWIPDSQYVSPQYGEVYVFRINFPDSNEPEETTVHFSPYYGTIHIVGKSDVYSITRIDSI